ncbi:MAG: hypothetical protein ACYTBV_13045 [Planctomycetota bacterium]|jgi:hypothetical protein
MKKSESDFTDFVHAMSLEKLLECKDMSLKARLQWLEEANAFINKALGFKKRARFDKRFEYFAEKS